MRGATETLSRYHPILLFECTLSGISNFDITSYEIFEFLTQENSYSIFFLKDISNKENSLNFEQFDQALQYPFQAFNFIALAKG